MYESGPSSDLSDLCCQFNYVSWFNLHLLTSDLRNLKPRYLYDHHYISPPTSFPLFEHITNFGCSNIDIRIETTMTWWYDIEISQKNRVLDICLLLQISKVSYWWFRTPINTLHIMVWTHDEGKNFQFRENRGYKLPFNTQNRIKFTRYSWWLSIPRCFSAFDSPAYVTHAAMLLPVRDEPLLRPDTNPRPGPHHRPLQLRRSPTRQLILFSSRQPC